MKKILVITYYWPPSGGAGVQRWLKFAKYLPHFGWEPVIYTSENPEAPAIDYSLKKDIPDNITVLKTKIWEPYSLYKKFLGLKQEEKINSGFLSEKKKPKLAEKISVWIRGNFFIPDARKFWIQPSIKFLTEYLKKNPADVIVSTGPPHSMHLIALGVKRKLNIPWLADFRDPWTNIDFYGKLMLTKLADAKHKRLEKEVLAEANKVVTVSWNCKKDFEKIHKRNYEVITNGYDEDDFPDEEITLDKKFSVVHIGAMNCDRNPHLFWKALAEFVQENPDFKNDLLIRLIGKNDVSVIQSIEQNGLKNFTEIISYLPHEKVIQKIRASQVLLLPLNNTPNTLGIMPGKLFEYLAAKRPVFAIGNEEGDAAKIIHETKAGVIYNFMQKEKMKQELMVLYNNFKMKGRLFNNSGIEKYSRKNKTVELCNILNVMVG